MSEQTDPEGRCCPGWVRVLLIVSLAGNLIVAGLAGGAYLRDRDRDFDIADADEGLDRRQLRFLHMLPEDRRSEARDLMLQTSAEVHAHRAGVIEVQRRILDMMRSSDFAPDRFRGALDERRLMLNQLYGVLHGQIAMIMSRMTLAERQATADAIERKLEKRWSDKLPKK